MRGIGCLEFDSMRVDSLKLFSLVCACAVLFQACDQKSYWERTLVGPFQGEPYKREPSSSPASSLKLSPKFVLNVHWEGATNDPILCLREIRGTSVWARILVPRLEGQKEPRGRITELTLNKVKTTKDGFKVQLSCYWIGGGKEGGIIYLGTNYSFRYFALGW